MSEKVRPCTYYYKIWVDESDPLAMVCIERDDKGFNEHRFNEGKWIEDWPQGVTFYVEGEHPEDYLLGGPFWMVVSERVRQVCEEFEECKVKGVQFLPVRVVHKESGEEIGPYWAVNVVQVVEALDWERTRWLYPEKKDQHKDPIFNIVKEAFHWEPLKGVDIFHLSIKGRVGTSVYISQRLKWCLEQARATKGFKFIPIPAY
jgi:hypothetical protein